MQNRRLAVIGLAVAAPIAFATAACETDTGTPSVTPTTAPVTSAPTPASPKDALLVSVKHLTTTTFRAKANLNGGITVAEAAIDPTAKAGTAKATSSAAGATAVVEQITVGGEAFVKAALNYRGAPTIPAGWMKLDLSKVKEPNDFNLADPDPSGLASELFKGLGPVEKSGERGFKGTLDLVKGRKAGIVNERTVERLTDHATAVPFEATVDDKRRIATFKILIPAVATAHLAAQTWDVAYSDWGTTVSVTKPTNAVPAPQGMYDYINT